MNDLFFDNWQSLYRAIIVTVLGYAALIIAIRISGKRTLAKMNAFDFVVTIALGSCLAALSLNKNIALAEGVLVLTTLISLQFLISWLSVRFSKVKEIVSGKPVLLLYQGKLLTSTLRKERITEEEVLVALRSSGLANLNQAEAAILETTGDISVLPRLDQSIHTPDVFKNVELS